MIGERITIKMSSVAHLRYAYHGVVCKHRLWFWPVITYHC